MSSRPSRGAARLAAILDALPDALVLVNANGTVVNANTIALEAFESPGTALVGRGLLDLLPEFDSRLIPGSMRRPDHMDPRGLAKPTRMIARRTDGAEFPVEVTSANLENGQQAYDGYGYTGDELLMIVVRDLSGTVDTEAELARSQRQTEMILRAASEGVVGTDTDGRIVLVNPAAAQILGYRAGELGGKELHNLVLHSRADGSPFPYGESPLADTLRSGRKHRVRGQVLWSKGDEQVSVDLTTAPVRDGDQLVGAVMTFADRRPYDTLADEKDALEKAHAEELERLSEEHASDLTALRQQHVSEVEELREKHAAEVGGLREKHEEEIASGEDRYAALAEREKDRYEALAARHEQLLTLLARSLRGPLDELRRDLSALAADDAGQLWPEANQVLHHLSAGYSRITTLIDNVLGYQRLDAGTEDISRTKVMLDAVVAAGVEGAVELIGPGRVQFAVHAPPIEAEVDPQRLATALAHLVADVAGVDATGNTPLSAGGYLDNTVVVAAAQRGEVARIEVRGPYPGGDPVHEPMVRGIVRAHGGVLQTHEVPGMSGSAYVLEVPLGGGAGAVPAAAMPALGAGPSATPAPTATPAPAATAITAVTGEAPGAELALPGEQAAGGGRRRARRGSTDAFLDGESGDEGGESSAPTGRRRRRAAAGDEGVDTGTGAAPSGHEGEGASSTGASGGTGRRRGRAADSGAGVDSGAGAEGDADAADAAGVAGVPGGAGLAGVSEGAVMTAAEHAAGTPAANSGLGAAVPPGGTVPPQGVPAGQHGRNGSEQAPSQAPAALPPALPSGSGGSVADGSGADGSGADASGADGGSGEPPTGRRRRALAAAAERAAAQETGARTVFALPPAAADRAPEPAAAPPGAPGAAGTGVAEAGRHDAVPVDQSGDHTPPQPHPTSAPTGRRRRAVARPDGGADAEEAPQAAGVGAAAQHAPGAQAAGVRVAPGGPAVPLVPQQGAPVPGGPGQLLQPGQVLQPGQALQPGQVLRAAASVTGTMEPDDESDAGATGSAGAVGPGGVPERAEAAVPAQAAGGQGPGSHGTSAGQGGPGSGGQPIPAQGNSGASAHVPAPSAPAAVPQPQAQPLPAEAAPGQPVPAQPPAATVPQQWPGTDAGAQAPAVQAPRAARPAGPGTPAAGTPLPPEHTGTGAGAAPARSAQPLPAENAAPAADPHSTQGRAISVRTLGQGVPFTRQAAQVQQPTATPPPHGTAGGGRRRKLGTPAARPESQQPDPAPAAGAQPGGTGEQPAAPAAAQPPRPAPNRTAPGTEGAGRSYAIGAPDADADEGPEPLDGPGGAVEIADTPREQPLDDELPPEPLDNPRRLLVWPAPDATTQQALSDRGYRPVVVHSRDEVDAQIAAFPAALFVDPLTGPITRTALQSLRQAAVAAEVPVLVTAGLGQATREAAYGADPAVLLKALAPRDSEQHPPRVLLIEEHAEIALALTSALERRGMQVARAGNDADAVTLAGQLRPNLVVMDLMQVHRREAGATGIIDWLRANGQLNRTPLVVYTAAVEPADLPRLASGETVLFLAERSTSTEVQSRIVDLLARIGVN
ncbi:PAS domain-containing protein [Streptomyces sp. J2-1]|uniref:hybrid sensor histidine kinase/response regulator n=1 Tax=Streptomyces corallincola TaxID=2851888 RepID=UPI001C387B68|nr:PAS domain-containing protein [Streptomyces corallincola]MBV2356862.1 PAS domain-containing protein [Streptomyces corallincola]